MLAAGDAAKRAGLHTVAFLSITTCIKGTEACMSYPVRGGLQGSKNNRAMHRHVREQAAQNQLLTATRETFLEHRSHEWRM